MMYFDTKRLPLLKGENNTMPREYMFVGIDDFSKELYACIGPGLAYALVGNISCNLTPLLSSL